MPRNQRLELHWYNKHLALIPSEPGVYDYEWVDQTDPRYCEVHTLEHVDTVRGEQEEKDPAALYSPLADLEPTTDNLLIHGDSGDVLEALTTVPELSKKYAGRVKLCYIDPPFNTKSVFDAYDDNLEHSVWLTMMRDRLEHIKTLLSADGTIWVHLDHIQSHRMRLLLDEVFGPGNFIAEFAWEKAEGARADTDISTAHDVITVYKKSSSADFKAIRNLIPRSMLQIARYQNPDNDPRGPWRQGDNGTAKSGSDDARFPITLPSGREVVPPAGSYWRFSRETFETARAENRVWFGAKGDSLPVIKRYLSRVQAGVVPRTWWPADEVGSNQEAKRDHLRKMFPGIAPFDTPKPERLMERIIHIATDPGDLVLDVFAGSGSTAAVAQKMGRRWVTCELLDSVIETYTRPRLEKVVNNQDPLGITTTNDRIPRTPHIEVPEKNSPDEMADAFTLIGRILSQDDLTAAEIKTLKDARDLLAMQKANIINWRGGGGFEVMRLSPNLYDYDPDTGRVTLTPDAHGQRLVASVAAHLGFELTPGESYHGRKGNNYLSVYEGTVTPDIARDLAAGLPDNATLTVAALGVADGTTKSLRDARRGSVVRHIPFDLFTVETKEH